MQLFDEKQHHGLQPEVIIQRSIRTGRKGRMTERASQFFVKMKQQGLQPNVVTYDAAVGPSAAIRAGDK